ncbi:hypothetical protein Leryth_009924 [Lithospermum erythrorhizon]|nr:hypothetical protein Leryth_009924 [Lithospermum erythrorhizon]
MLFSGRAGPKSPGKFLQQNDYARLCWTLIFPKITQCFVSAQHFPLRPCRWFLWISCICHFPMDHSHVCISMPYPSLTLSSQQPNMNDAYRATGCYNLLCSGFVQTNHKIAIGAAITPTSSYRGGQFDISLLIWKDPKHGNWWLQFGSGILVGYWPSFLFTHLRGHATMVQFGGEVVNNRRGSHTSTQMGSGEGFKHLISRILSGDWDNNLIPPPNLKVLADHLLICCLILGGYRVWGNYFYYGGPGRNPRCP